MRFFAARRRADSLPRCGTAGTERVLCLRLGCTSCALR